MNLTKDQVKVLDRKREQPTREPGELLAVWVSGKLVNTKNRRLHWKSESRYKRTWREAVAMALFEAGWHRLLQSPPTPLVPGMKLIVLGGGFDEQVAIPGKAPKRIVIRANVHGLMDSIDGLRVACAPIVDELKSCGVISDDADKHGHLIEYAQRIDRAHRGVEIRVSLLRTP